MTTQKSQIRATIFKEELPVLVLNEMCLRKAGQGMNHRFTSMLMPGKKGEASSHPISMSTEEKGVWSGGSPLPTLDNFQVLHGFYNQSFHSTSINDFAHEVIKKKEHSKQKRVQYSS